MDDLQICTTPDSTERDDLTICRQHAFIVTHANTNERYMAAAQKKLDDANPAIIEERRQHAEDLKRVAKEDERNSKAVDIANAKEQELFHFSQVLKKAAVERNNAFIKARDEQIKIKKAIHKTISWWPRSTWSGKGIIRRQVSPRQSLPKKADLFIRSIRL